MFRRVTTLAVGLAVAAGLVTAGASSASAATYKTPSLSIVANHASYIATQNAVFTVHLAGPPEQPVYIFRTSPHAKPVFWTEVDTDVHGNASLKVPMIANATWSASYRGNDKYYPALANTYVKVYAYLTTKLGGYYKTVNGYHDVHAGSKATLDGSVYPDRHGEYLYFSAQYYSGKSWHNITGKAFKMGLYHTSSGVAYSAAGSTFLGTKGYYYRLSVSYRGDTYLGPRGSGWYYLHVV